jgi:hypothetical protein
MSLERGLIRREFRVLSLYGYEVGVSTVVRNIATSGISITLFMDVP